MPTLTIQPSDIDSHLRSNESNNNFGTSALFVRSKFGNYRIVIKFDFSALPDRSLISSAILSIYYDSTLVGTPEGRIYEANRLTQIAWAEDEVTWNIYSTGNSWGSAGGDFTSVFQSTAVVPAVGNWLDFEVTNQVLYAYSSVSKVAHILIKDQTEGVDDHGASFYSNDEAVNLTLRPKLVINYISIDDIDTTKPTKLYSGVKESFPKDGWENEKNFFVEQSSPHPCVVQYWDLFVDTSNE